MNIFYSYRSSTCHGNRRFLRFIIAIEVAMFFLVDAEHRMVYVDILCDRKLTILKFCCADECVFVSHDPT